MLRSLKAAAYAQAVIEVFGGVLAHAGFTAVFGDPRVEAAQEGASGLVHPFVEVPDHVEHGVLTPLAATARRVPSAPEQGSGRRLHEVQARVQVVFRSVTPEDVGRMGLASDVA